jgi:hypothetical protein
MKSSYLFLGAIGLFVISSCGKDNPKPDQAVSADLSLDQSVVLDNGGQSVDQQIPDTGVPPNSGLVCETEKQCAAGDTCINVYGSQKKICLTQCDPKYLACPVPNPAKNSSLCVFNKDPNHTYCIWICLYDGKTYDCPVPDAYNCEPANPSNPSVKVCLPK